MSVDLMAILVERRQKPHPSSYIHCADGFVFSVQASQFHYCSPRKDNASVYTHVEVGYPNRLEPMLEQYREEGDEHSEVFPFVPASVVEQIIEKHGGIK